MTLVNVGDVLAIRSGGRPAWWIRVGAAIADKPNLSNHIAVMHHTDKNGTPWAIEGRPGGVGYVDARKYLRSPYTITNVDQPKSPAQRAAVAKTMEALLGTAYDWEAIVMDGLSDVGVSLPGWSPTWSGTVPGHVVCSSLAAYAYAKNGLPCPKGDRNVQPADWDAFIVGMEWKLPPEKRTKIYGD